MKKIEGLKPFGRFIMTIGQLPASYLVSMTYEEQLLWFCNYLQNTVIPTVNNNAEAVEELQNLFIELKSYVDNYFENLDVQEEINNKLDEMAESGELAELISQYLGLGALFVYDTALDLAGAENLQDGSSAYILGKETYNDGKGAFYKIRELLNTDVPDGDNIITLTETENLVAEKLPNYRMNQAESAIDTINNTTIPAIQDDVNTINNETIPAIEEEIKDIPLQTVGNFNNAFEASNITLLSESGYKVIEPFIVEDKTTGKYYMFYSSTQGGLYCKRAESTDLIHWNVMSSNVLTGDYVPRHKMVLLVDTAGNPVKIDDKYHAYTVSSTPKEIYHWEATALNGNWTETGKAIARGLEGNYDDYGVDAPYAIYDERNKKVIIWYMAQTTLGNYKSTIMRATSDTPENGFTYEATVLAPESSTWYSGWIGGLQILKTNNEYKVIFNASSANPLGPGSEPDPSAIGIGTMKDLYSNVIPPKNPSLQINTSLPGNINTYSIWRGNLVYNKFTNNYMMFYNTGGSTGDEIITYALNKVYNYIGTNSITALESTDPVILPGTQHYLTLPNVYRLKLSVRCMINGVTTDMKLFRIKIRMSSNQTLGSIQPADTTLIQREVFLGNYNYQNENVDVETVMFLNDPNANRVYATIELAEGTIGAANKPAYRDAQFTIEAI